MSTAANPRLLVVDDEPDLRTLYELTLLREGFDVDSVGTVAEAWAQLEERGPGGYQLLITDMRLPDGTGLQLLRRLEEAGRVEKAVVITAYGSPENAVEALKAGAYDYLTKPVDLRQFRSVVASALGRTPLPPGAPRAAAGGPPLPRRQALARLLGDSAPMQQVRSLIDRVARSMAPVLVQGESGTGKELVARAIHDCSARAGGPFIAVNCGAIPEHLLEAEFFGYRKGAFTGAQDDRDGFFQAAQGGTLFLDEIGDLPLAMQSKLLRAIQERAVRAVGATAELPVNVRIVSATHRELGAEVAAGRFRQDLYYRLNVICIGMPALRERLGDVPQLCAHVLARIARDAGIEPAPSLSPAALSRLLRHGFPGNVRELENLLHRALALAAGPVIDTDDLGLPEPGADGAQAPWLGVPAAPASPAVTAAAAAPASPAPTQAALGDPAALPMAARPALAAAPLAPPPAARAPESPAHQPLGAASGPVPSPASGGFAGAGLSDPREVSLPRDLVAYLDEVERTVLERALERHRYNRTAAGASLGLSLRQMRYRMARLGIGADTAAPEADGG